jgi:hypothetical protein
VNSNFYALQAGPNGVMYSTDHNSGLYKSENGGRHWTKVFSSLSVTSRVWIDPERPTDLYRWTEHASESEPVELCHKLAHSTDGGQSFQPVAIPACVVESVGVAGPLVCYAMPGSIRCSENAGPWQNVPMTPLLASIAIDRRLNSHPELTIDRRTRELLILSGGTLYESLAGRTVVARKTVTPAIAGRLIDLVLDADRMYPAWGISGIDSDGQWKLTQIGAAGETASYAGPKATGFRLTAVDAAHETVWVWTLEGIYRGVVR